MTPSILQWLADSRKQFPFHAGIVVEVGALDVNGNPRSIFQDATKYIGIDQQLGKNVDCIANAESLPLPDEYADTVVCCELLEHVIDPSRVVAELKRILKPGGTLIVTSPANGFPMHQYPLDCWRLMPDAWPHIVFAGCKILSVSKTHDNITCGIATKH